MKEGKDWFDVIKALVDQVAKAEERLKDAIENDPLPAEEVQAASEALALLWDFMVDITGKDDHEAMNFKIIKASELRHDPRP